MGVMGAKLEKLDVKEVKKERGEYDSEEGG